MPKDGHHYPETIIMNATTNTTTSNDDLYTLDMTVRTTNILLNAGIHTVEQLLNGSWSELAAVLEHSPDARRHTIAEVVSVIAYLITTRAYYAQQELELAKVALLALARANKGCRFTTKAQALATIRVIPKAVLLTARVELALREQTAFRDVAELVASITREGYHYRPTLYTSSRAQPCLRTRQANKLIRDYYNAVAASLGSDKRAYEC